MPFRPFMAKLLLAHRVETERQALHAVDEAAHKAARHAKELRDERTARLRLTETRNRLGGWRT